METKKLTEKQRELLLEFVDRKCEVCGRNEAQIGRLEIHRPKQGAPYSLRNVQVVCKYNGLINGRYSCHSLFNSAQNKAAGITR